MKAQKVFTFGTLTDARTRKEALGRDVPAQVALLPRHEKIITGIDRATILAQDESIVVGVVFEVSPKELRVLDGYERQYKRKRLRLHDGSAAWVYVLKKIK